MPTSALDIAPVLLTDSEATIIGPVPVGQEYNIPVIRFVNNDSSDHTITLWNKQSGSAGTNTQLEAITLTVQAQSIYEHGPVVLAAGRYFSALVDVSNKVNAVVHGWVTS